MYKIIGADGQAYGPVPAEQVCRWIAEGRADGQTKAQTDGGSDWKALSDFPEFAEALAARSDAARPSPPTISAVDAEKLAAEIIARDHRLDIGDCFSRSWNLIRDNFWLLVGATAVVLVVASLLSFAPVLGIPASVVLGFVLWAGLDLLFLKRLRGEPAEVGTVLAGFSLAIVPLMLASMVAHVLTSIGLVLCVLPGIYLLVAWWMFVPLLIIDKRLEFWPAMELSRKVVTRQWWPCFGLFGLSCMVGLIGLMGCGVGIFFAIPIAVGATVNAYEDMFGARPVMNELPVSATPAAAASTPDTPAAASPPPSEPPDTPA